MNQKIHLNNLLGQAVGSLRLPFLLIPFVVGCAHERVLRVTGPYPDSPTIRRCLEYWTSNFSTNTVNHYYVGKVYPRGGFADALVYWKEERTILELCELKADAPEGAEAEAWHHTLKLDRDTVDTLDEIGGSNFVETHRTWVDWMEGCLSHGREYVIPLEEAGRLCPKKKIPDDI